MVKRALRWSTTALLLVLATGCATGRAVRAGQDAVLRGDWDTAVAYYRQAHASDPGRIDVKISLERVTREAAAAHLARARALESQDQLAGALAEYRLAADLEPSNTLSITKAMEIERRIRDQIEANRPPPRMQEMQRQAQAQSPIPRLDPRTRVPIINFPSAAVRDILSAMSAVTGHQFHLRPEPRRAACASVHDQRAGRAARRGAQSGPLGQHPHVQGAQPEDHLHLSGQSDQPAEVRGSVPRRRSICRTQKSRRWCRSSIRCSPSVRRCVRS